MLAQPEQRNGVRQGTLRNGQCLKMHIKRFLRNEIFYLI